MEGLVLADISLVIPVFNEADSIEHFLDECEPILKSLCVTYEFVFVDDGSSDATWTILKNLSETRSHIRALRLIRNFGKEAALTAGLEAARGKTHIPIDVDLQDPPQLIPEMYKLWQSGFDVVLAKRVSRKDPLWRRLAANVFYVALERGSKVKIPREVGDFRLMDSAVTKEFLSLKERGRYNKGLLALVSRNSTVIHFERPKESVGHGKSRKSRQSLLKLVDLGLTAVVSFNTWPLKALSVFGLLLTSSAFLVAIAGVVLKFLGILEVPGQATVIVGISALMGVQSTLSGILGLYMGEILREVKARPIFIELEKLENSNDEN